MLCCLSSPVVDELHHGWCLCTNARYINCLEVVACRELEDMMSNAVALGRY